MLNNVWYVKIQLPRLYSHVLFLTPRKSERHSRVLHNFPNFIPVQTTKINVSAMYQFDHAMIALYHFLLTQYPVCVTAKHNIVVLEVAHTTITQSHETARVAINYSNCSLLSVQVLSNCFF